MNKGQKTDTDILDWFTISYRNIYIVAGIVVALILGGGYYLFFKGQQTEAPPAEETEAPPTARLTSIEGNVRVKAQGTFEWVAATTAVALRQGDLVRTSPGATAEMTFVDGTTVLVRPDSLLTVEATGHTPGPRRRIALKVSSGRVHYSKSSVTGSAEVSTPTVKLTQAGPGKGGLSVADSGETDVRIFEGDSAMMETSDGRSFNLGAREAVRVDSTGRAGPRRELPSVPTLRTPPHEAEIAYKDPSETLTMLAWGDVPQAVGYRIQVDYNAHFNRPLIDNKVNGTSATAKGLAAGRYYWRVAAVAQGGEGSFADYSRFTIVSSAGKTPDGAPPPPLAIESLDVRTNILQVKGRTEPGAAVTVNGQRIDVGADGAFNEFVTLNTAGEQVVLIRAVGLNGGVAERKRTVVVAAF